MECVNLLFLILLSSSLSHTVRAAEKTLDMAPDAVDDVFSGCRERMLKAVTEADGLLQKELQTTEKFAEMWKNTKTCNKQIQGLTSFHLNALESYANCKTDIRKTFNDKVYASGNNATTYKNEFSFKSLHFLLTDAMKHLNGGKTHMQVFYGTGNEYKATTGKEVRFGKFILSESKRSAQEEKVSSDGGGTLFIITSGSVVNVENYTCSSEEMELLISPTEVFTVENIQTASKDDTDFKIITLNHSRFLSNHDCYLFDGISEATTPSSRDRTQAPGGSSSSLLSSMVLAWMASILSSYYCT
uniref:NAD(P)(+)--arginine ADP-ribosyltransferase n=1 Tax=Astyanax mexicanus TaxID=7994 RepID=A0A8B9RM24_ASTMX